MDVSVIIPTLNEQQALPACAASVWDSGADEVIVADGGSTDQTVELAESMGCRCVSSQPGRGTQLLAGTRIATGNVCLLLHADNRLHSQAIQQIRNSVRDANTLFGAFRQRIEADGPIYRLIETGNRFRARFLRLIYGDQGMFVRTDALQRAGGVPDVPLFEDVILSQRLNKLSRPAILDGPIYVDARRWREHGVVRQTLRNWSLILAFRCGASPEQLARYYRRHSRRVRPVQAIAVPSK